MKHAIKTLKLEREMLTFDLLKPDRREKLEDLDQAVAVLDSTVSGWSLIPETFEGKIRHAINCHSRESGSDTPDFILAGYLLRCLENFDATVTARTKWYAPPEPEDHTLPLPGFDELPPMPSEIP